MSIITTDPDTTDIVHYVAGDDDDGTTMVTVDGLEVAAFEAVADGSLIRDNDGTRIGFAKIHLVGPSGEYVVSDYGRGEMSVAQVLGTVKITRRTEPPDNSPEGMKIQYDNQQKLLESTAAAMRDGVTRIPHPDEAQAVTARDPEAVAS